MFYRSVTAQGDGQGLKQSPRPTPGKPEGTFPDLDTVKSESQLAREALPPIPSTIRSPKNSGKPWDGRRVGDPLPPQTSGHDLERGQTRRAHARRRESAPPAVLDDQFVQNFFTWAAVRAPYANELTFWNDQFRVAYAQGQSSVMLAGVALGKTLFESAEYAARNRNDHWYVY
ncbi:MAG TPA: hypothetical protein VF290_06815, partial [Pyrinomonadaceae bacterium]